MNMSRVSVLQTHSGAQMWISQSHRDLVWLHFLSPQGPRAQGLSPVSCSGKLELCQRTTRRRFHSGAATNRAQGGEINVVCRRLSCVFCRFMLQWTLDVGWISWLTFKQKTKKLHLRIYRPWQELSMFWWMSQLAGGEQIKDCWVALPNILVSVEILFQNCFKKKIIGFAQGKILR